MRHPIHTHGAAVQPHGTTHVTEAVLSVTEDRMFPRGKLHTNLMRPARKQPDRDKALLRAGNKPHHTGERSLARTGTDLFLSRRPLLFHAVLKQNFTPLPPLALDPCEIEFTHPAGRELIVQLPQGFVILCDQQQAGGIPIKPVRERGPKIGIRVHGCQTPGHGIGDLVTTVRGQTGGLGNGKDMLVFVGHHKRTARLDRFHIAGSIGRDSNDLPS